MLQHIFLSRPSSSLSGPPTYVPYIPLDDNESLPGYVSRVPSVLSEAPEAFQRVPVSLQAPAPLRDPISLPSLPEVSATPDSLSSLPGYLTRPPSVDRQPTSTYRRYNSNAVEQLVAIQEVSSVRSNGGHVNIEMSVNTEKPMDFKLSQFPHPKMFQMENKAWGKFILTWIYIIWLLVIYGCDFFITGVLLSEYQTATFDYDVPSVYPVEIVYACIVALKVIIFVVRFVRCVKTINRDYMVPIAINRYSTTWLVTTKGYQMCCFLKAIQPRGWTYASKKFCYQQLRGSLWTLLVDIPLRSMSIYCIYLMLNDGYWYYEDSLASTLHYLSYSYPLLAVMIGIMLFTVVAFLFSVLAFVAALVIYISWEVRTSETLLVYLTKSINEACEQALKTTTPSVS